MRCLHKAYRFLCLVFFLLNSHANISSASSSSTTQLCSIDEAAALIQFKSSFSIYKSASWFCDDASMKFYPKTDSWKEGTDCCSWDGVTCDDINGHVIGLDLACSWLYGSIPSNSTLFHLPHLQKLNLAFNDFDISKMSFKFGEFPSLVYLNLSWTNFAGQVPSRVSYLSKLVSLDLSGNYHQTLDKRTLEGLVHNLTVVRQLFLDGINMSPIKPNVLMNLSSSLRSLSLLNCDLRGKFPENIFHLPNLKMLYLGGNYKLSLGLPKFNGSSHLQLLDLSDMSFSRNFFDSIGDLVSLEHLDASGSFFSDGGFPNSIGNLISLKHLDFSYSNLIGSIPRSLGNLSQIRYLDLSSNSFSGHITSTLTNLKQLQFLNIGGNLLEGSIPDEVIAFPNLILLSLSNNLLNGTLPSWLYTISSLKHIYLSHNQFSGQIKDFQYSSLEVIYIANNKLQGPIPSSISQLVNLTWLDLSANNLSGIVESDKPSKLGKLSRLDLSSNTQISFSSFSGPNYSLPNIWLLNLSSCNISAFPDFIRNLAGLEELHLSHNQIPVIDQSMFLRLENLNFLDLSHNSQLSLSIGSNVKNLLPNLWSLSFSSCGISEFPNFLRTLKNLTYLDLSNNTIQGRVSKGESEGWPSLTNLDLSHNFLTDLDHYPGKNLQVLSLQSNLLEGSILVPPPSINVFQVSGNKLTGEIPPLICNLSSLQILDLSDNNLNGTIPTCLWFFSNNLQVLDLQKNSFHGSIPDSFAKENKLESLNLNGNDFDGPFPQSLLNCSKLAVLNLGNNRLNDTFPNWLGSLQELQVLVLRSNNFHGPISKAKTESPFPKLRILDLSHNEFSGVLPTTYFKSFKSMMNLDNVQVGYMGGGGYYQDSVVVSMKGAEIEFERILTIFTTIDLSSNQFEGKFPEVGELHSLKVLNFSHNSLSGCIPPSMGKLAAIESLDLSSNKLIGEIPKQLTNLNFLAVLNLSQNQLSGPIPQGNQFNTFTNDSYSDNLGLCGVPLSKRCSENEAPAFQEEGDGSASGFEWKGVLMGYGCGLVFGLSAGYIILTIGKPEWLVRIVERAGNKLKGYF